MSSEDIYMLGREVIHLAEQPLNRITPKEYILYIEKLAEITGRNAERKDIFSRVIEKLYELPALTISEAEIIICWVAQGNLEGVEVVNKDVS